MKQHLKIITALSLFLLCAARICAQVHPVPQAPQGPTGAPAAPAQTQTPPAANSAAPQTKVDPAKAADIQRLLELTGMKTLVTQTMSNMVTTLRPQVIDSLPPGDYREKLVDLFFAKFQTKLNISQLLDMAAASYDKYLSDDDIKGLIQFYQTPIGQKTLTVLPNMLVEIQTQARQLGEQAGRDSMIEVLAENPDLAKALQDASK